MKKIIIMLTMVVMAVCCTGCTKAKALDKVEPVHTYTETRINEINSFMTSELYGDGIRYITTEEGSDGELITTLYVEEDEIYWYYGSSIDSEEYIKIAELNGFDGDTYIVIHYEFDDDVESFDDINWSRIEFYVRGMLIEIDEGAE